MPALTQKQAETIRLVLKGEKARASGRGLECIRSLTHGHVEAVLTAIRRQGFDKLIDGKASRERDLVVATVAGRIIAPEASKLAMTHAFADTTLAEDFCVTDAHEDELYAAVDWPIERQDKACLCREAYAGPTTRAARNSGGSNQAASCSAIRRPAGACTGECSSGVSICDLQNCA